MPYSHIVMRLVQPFNNLMKPNPNFTQTSFTKLSQPIHHFRIIANLGPLLPVRPYQSDIGTELSCCVLFVS